MKINIYTSFNGVGLERDFNILRKIFEARGDTVGSANWRTRHMKPNHADVAIHLEIPRYDLIRFAPRNIMIPNPEWFEMRWLRNIHLFDSVYAKTRDCERIFKPHHKEVIFTSFTSIDKFNQRIKKDKAYVHCAGKSSFKGTNELINAYENNPLPVCYLTTQNAYLAKGNMMGTGYLNEQDFDILLNACLIHIMPSYYEGFGHAIWEAMSCAAAVITTDAPPMNEFITDKRFLVSSGSHNPHHMGVLYHPNVNMAEIIKNVDLMPLADIVYVGKQNRAKFLQNDKDFRQKIVELIC